MTWTSDHSWVAGLAFAIGVVVGMVVMFMRCAAELVRAGDASWKWEAECYEWRDAARARQVSGVERK